ncbi:MAG: ATP-binding cassette domain-containing protein [Oscillospiraceae bacterium]|nr:ATP-binding cassette domain-containing protein [Oscillospiraceae bacterium]
MDDYTMIECDNLVKIYKTRDTEVMALAGLDLTVRRGELMAIIGASGSGKSTLLNMLGGLDTPTMGQLTVDGRDMLKISRSALAAYKRGTVGFVWQNNARNLIPYLTARENVELVGRIGGRLDKQYAARLLELVGLSDRKNNKLGELSGGEQQRVATAIALINKPALLLADEPTGAVDSKTSQSILGMFAHLRDELGVTVVIVSHDPGIAKMVDRVVAIRDGKTSGEIMRAGKLTDIASLASLEEEQIELAVVDRSGRVQIPADYLTRLSIGRKDKVRIEAEDGRIVIYPTGADNGSV